MCLIVWLYGLVRSSRLVVFWGLLLRDRRWLHGQAGTFAQLSALVAAPIGIDAAMRLARRQVYKWSSASRRRSESHPTMRRRWTIVGPIIVPIVLIWPYMQMRHCRNLRGNTGAHEATDSVLACSNRSSRCGPLARRASFFDHLVARQKNGQPKPRRRNLIPHCWRTSFNYPASLSSRSHL